LLYHIHTENTEATLKSEILQVSLHNPERFDRLGVMGIAAANANVDEKSWVDLLQFVVATWTGSDTTERELAFWFLAETSAFAELYHPTVGSMEPYVKKYLKEFLVAVCDYDQSSRSAYQQVMLTNCMCSKLL